MDKQTVFALLEKEGLSSRSKWQDASIIEFFREMISGTGERKQLFAEFQNYIRNKEKDDKRKAVQQARVDFKTALESYVDADNYQNITFASVSENFSSQSFWKLLSEEELDDILFAYLDDYERNCLAVIKDVQQKRISNLAKLLSQDERFNADTPFEKVIPLIPGNSKLELLLAWEEFVEKNDREAASRKKLFRQKKERKARLAFRKLLENFPGKSWPEVQAAVKDRECYIELIGSRGSQPFDLFTHVYGGRRSRSVSSVDSLD
jgi:hypothetical protein